MAGNTEYKNETESIAQMEMTTNAIMSCFKLSDAEVTCTHTGG